MSFYTLFFSLLSQYVKQSRSLGDSDYDQEILDNLDYILDGVLLELEDPQALIMRSIQYSQQIAETAIITTANLTKV